MPNNTVTTGGTSPRFYTRLPPNRSGPKAPRGGGGGIGGGVQGGGDGGGWVGLGQALIRTSRTMDVALPCASLLVRRVLGCPVARPAGLMTAPVPRGGTRGREMPPCLCVWGARAACVCGAGAGGATRHVGSHGSAAPGPAPVLFVSLGGVLDWAQSPVPGSGGGSVLPVPALHWHNAGSSRHVGSHSLSCCSRREGPTMGHTCCGVHPQRATGIRRHGLGQR